MIEHAADQIVLVEVETIPAAVKTFMRLCVPLGIVSAATRLPFIIIVQMVVIIDFQICRDLSPMAMLVVC